MYWKKKIKYIQGYLYRMCRIIGNYLEIMLLLNGTDEETFPYEFHSNFNITHFDF